MSDTLKVSDILLIKTSSSPPPLFIREGRGGISFYFSYNKTALNIYKIPHKIVFLKFLYVFLSKNSVFLE